ncbi:MAG: dinitrogenase iron-molybdenum cofactor biosynthesis protein [Proteobacteria bacterium]|nr:dinitrogenase iron-molybdenum cofactor biosynthesis protein [Pseudomonadota bacterium]MBU1596194.1 dinitrogenase iron-molybdenum cofactor biosynthesis protein [Pseudomonadota bacterium]
MTMLICLACYGDRLATLMESATELRFYHIERGLAVAHGNTSVPQNGVLAIANMLTALRIDVLICGGLSGCGLGALQQSGVSVVPWVGGPAEEVAASWAVGGIEAMQQYRMPGCAFGGCGRRFAGLVRRRGQSIKTPHLRGQRTQATKVEESS